MTKVKRLNISNLKVGFTIAVENECDVMLATGFKLAAAFLQGDDLVMIFQK